MYQKIKLNLSNIDFDRLKGAPVTSYGNPPNPRLTYFKLGDVAYLKSLLPENMGFRKCPPHQVQIAEIVGSGHLLPHIDHNISACANFYVETNGSTTYFYKRKEGGQGFAYPGKKGENIFPLDQVEVVDQFIAQPGDFYLLNVAKIHSVDSPNNGIRKFISFQWFKQPFENIVEAIAPEYLDNIQK